MCARYRRPRRAPRSQAYLPAMDATWREDDREGGEARGARVPGLVMHPERMRRRAQPGRPLRGGGIMQANLSLRTATRLAACRHLVVARRAAGSGQRAAEQSRDQTERVAQRAQHHRHPTHAGAGRRLAPLEVLAVGEGPGVGLGQGPAQEGDRGVARGGGGDVRFVYPQPDGHPGAALALEVGLQALRKQGEGRGWSRVRARAMRRTPHAGRRPAAPSSSCRRSRQLGSATAERPGPATHVQHGHAVGGGGVHAAPHRGPAARQEVGRHLPAGGGCEGGGSSGGPRGGASAWHGGRQRWVPAGMDLQWYACARLRRSRPPARPPPPPTRCGPAWTRRRRCRATRRRAPWGQSGQRGRRAASSCAR